MTNSLMRPKNITGASKNKNRLLLIGNNNSFVNNFNHRQLVVIVQILQQHQVLDDVASTHHFSFK